MTKEERILKQINRARELKAFDEKYKDEGYTYIAGVDEVGRGPLAGPVVTACVCLKPEYEGLGIDDSKKVTEKNREKLYDEILANSICYGIGVCNNVVIDDINILEATKKAMKRCIWAAEEKLGRRLDLVLVDAVKIPGIDCEQAPVIKGDSKSLAIAAASIIAKVTRDRMMVEYDEIYPGYGFASNKGYGTAAHYEGLKKYGLSPIHRRSFTKGV